MIQCTVPAADYVMKYLVDGWQPVLNHRYGCEFGNNTTTTNNNNNNKAPRTTTNNNNN